MPYYPLQCGKMNLSSFKDINKRCLQIIYLIYTYKHDLALNNVQWVICHKTKPNQTVSLILSSLYLYM